MIEQEPNNPDLSPEQLTDQVWNKVRELARLAVANGYPSKKVEEATIVHLGALDHWAAVDLTISSEDEETPFAITFLDAEEPEVLTEDDEDLDEDGNWIHQDKNKVVIRYMEYGLFEDSPEVIAENNKYPEFASEHDWTHPRRVQQFFGERHYGEYNEFSDNVPTYKDWVEIPAWKRHSTDASEYPDTVEELSSVSELVDRLIQKVQQKSS